MREEGRGNGEQGRGILWLVLAAAVVVAVVVIVIVAGRRAPSPHDSSDRFAAVSPVDTQPQSNETDERTATVGRAVPRAPQSQEDEASSGDDSEPESEEEPQTEEEKREAEEEKLVNGFDDLTDKWQESSSKGVTMSDIDNFAKTFRSVPKNRQDECINRALNLIPDENVMLLAGVLMDKSMDKEIVETVYNDVLNRDEDVKKPILQQIFKDKSHPCWADTAWILDVTDELPKAK